ncbi:MAG: FAD-dependent oxidoreductase, partial [Armatimonadota bacterium]
GIDWPCINHSYPTADRNVRRAIEERYKDRALGYLYYFQNELGHRNLGLADDEFLDNGNFPPTLYVREARRIVGEYLFKENDVADAR